MLETCKEAARARTSRPKAGKSGSDMSPDFKVPVEIELYERKIYDLKQLIEISKGLNSTLEYNVLIDSILLTCMGHMQLIKAGIFLMKGIDHEIYTLHRNYKASNWTTAANTRYPPIRILSSCWRKTTSATPWTS